MRRWANRPFRELPWYSRPVLSHRTLKLMSLLRDGNTQQLQHADEVGIRAIVEDHEARVGGILAPERLERDRVRVPARIVVGLEYVDVVIGGEQAGREQPADARTNDCDSHALLLLHGTYDPFQHTRKHETMHGV